MRDKFTTFTQEDNCLCGDDLAGRGAIAVSRLRWYRRGNSRLPQHGRDRCGAGAVDSHSYSGEPGRDRRGLHPPETHLLIVASPSFLRGEGRALFLPVFARIVCCLLMSFPFIARSQVPSAIGARLEKGETLSIVTYGTSLTAGGGWVTQVKQTLERKFPDRSKSSMPRKAA